MRRIQLHITDQQDRRLRALAKKRRTTRADLIREGIELLLSRDAEDDPLLSLIGLGGKSGIPDLSERVDEIVYDHREDDSPLPKASERDGDP
jgi:Arc/MetJ-type ribon-helix-helix transcriptional regulator